MDVVTDFIYDQEEPRQEILLYLHELISSYPELIGKIRYKIPFYYRKSWICYLNPTKDGGVELAFPRGNELSNEQGLLMANGRKQVRGMTFYKIKDIPEDAIHEILAEALLLDEEVAYKSKRWFGGDKGGG